MNFKIRTNNNLKNRIPVYNPEPLAQRKLQNPIIQTRIPKQISTNTPPKPRKRINETAPAEQKEKPQRE